MSWYRLLPPLVASCFPHLLHFALSSIGRAVLAQTQRWLWQTLMFEPVGIWKAFAGVFPHIIGFMCKSKLATILCHTYILASFSDHSNFVFLSSSFWEVRSEEYELYGNITLDWNHISEEIMNYCWKTENENYCL